MADDPKNNKYAGKRNLWRKTYPRQRRKPNVVEFHESQTDVSFSYDLNKVHRHRDYFILKKVFNGELPPTNILAEYDEGLIYFNNTDSATTLFSFCFSQNPDAVVLTVEPEVDNSHNVIPFGFTFDSCSMNVGLSAPFSGSVRYRAVYSSYGYPAYVTSSFVPSSGSFIIYAGHVTASNSDTFTIPYNLGPSTPSAVRMTTWDFFANYDVDVGIQSSNGITGSNVYLSAPINNLLYFIAVQ